MLTLYYRPTCPFCHLVLGEAEEMGIQLDLKDISGDDTLRQELIEKGGKQQVPFLVDHERGISMYESADIVEYIKENYNNRESGRFSGLTVHRGNDTCDGCE